MHTSVNSHLPPPSIHTSAIRPFTQVLTRLLDSHGELCAVPGETVVTGTDAIDTLLGLLAQCKAAVYVGKNKVLAFTTNLGILEVNVTRDWDPRRSRVRQLGHPANAGVLKADATSTSDKKPERAATMQITLDKTGPLIAFLSPPEGNLRGNSARISAAVPVRHLLYAVGA